jgi:hypothetical protein
MTVAMAIEPWVLVAAAPASDPAHVAPHASKRPISQLETSLPPSAKHVT